MAESSEVNSNRGYVLGAHEIYDLVKRQIIVPSNPREVCANIQPSSYELRATEKIVRVPPAFVNSLLINKGRTIDQQLEDLSLSDKHIVPVDSQGRFEFRPGFTYLVETDTSLCLPPNYSAKNTPKSTTGRTFQDTRALSANQSTLDYFVHNEFDTDEPKRIWLSVQPKIHATRMRVGQALSQLRIIEGDDARLTSKELREMNAHDPLLYSVAEDLFGDFRPAPLQLIDGELMLKLSLHSPNGHNKRDKLEARTGDCWILFTKEYMHIPKNVCAEMCSYSPDQIRGPLHYAGFFDPNFKGQAVIELSAQEDASLIHNMPIVRFVFYRMRETPKHPETGNEFVYGANIGSSYSGQRGPQIAHHFRHTDLSSYVALRAKPHPDCIDMTLPRFQPDENSNLTSARANPFCYYDFSQ